MSYSELLKDPRWQKKRLEILSRDNFQCKVCCSTEKTLHVHHQYYIKSLNPWEYKDESLITLCDECHEDVDTYDWKTAFLNMQLPSKELLELAVTIQFMIDTKRPLFKDSKYAFNPSFVFQDPYFELMTNEQFDEFYREYRDKAINNYRHA